jgi:hypothetical protein
VLDPTLSAGAFDENAPHRRGGGREEMPTVVPARRVRRSVPDQSQVCLMHQGGRLERMTGRLGGHALPGQCAQLVVNDREQLLCGMGLAAVDRREQARNPFPPVTIWRRAAHGVILDIRFGPKPLADPCFIVALTFEVDKNRRSDKPLPDLHG